MKKNVEVESSLLSLFFHKVIAEDILSTDIYKHIHGIILI